MANQKKNYTDIKVTPLPEREVEILGTISKERMSELREKALQNLKKDVELPGFRKGNAPESLVAQKVGELRLMEEASEIALQEEYPNILDEHNIDAIGRPEITITKLAPGNPLEFKIKTYLMPEVKLADYKKIAKENNNKDKSVLQATDKEVNDVIKNLQKSIAHQKMHADMGLDEHSHDHAEIKDEDLPPIDDNFIKILGNFKDLEEFKTKIKENIVAEKELKEKDKGRVEILEAVIEKSTIELPKIIIEGESDKMMAQFQDDIAKSGFSFEEYLKHINKTEKDLREEWKETAVKRAKSQVILNNISKEENVVAKEEDIKREMEHLLSHHKDADRFRVRMYVETFLTNELVFQFLESQK